MSRMKKLEGVNQSELYPCPSCGAKKPGRSAGRTAPNISHCTKESEPREGKQVLDQKSVFQTLAANGVSYFVGVPDSYLNGFVNYAIANCGERNVITANEGNAIALAAGHYIASQELPLVYMQNSGTGNAVNPLASLTEKRVYSIPMLLLIGWRGQVKDGISTEPKHPQHMLQGEITTSLMDIMKIPYTVLTDDDAAFAETAEKAAAYCREARQPYALISTEGVKLFSLKISLSLISLILTELKISPVCSDVS